MTIAILTDNSAGSNTLAEHGLSYFIEHDGKRILFDTGQSNIFQQNAQRIKKNIANIDWIVLSHGHFDHGNGLQFLNDEKLLCHPAAFTKRYRKTDLSYIGLKYSRDEIEKKFELKTTKVPYAITQKIFFLGEIPRKSNFESRTTPFVFEDGSPDFVQDDSALALLCDKGLFVITGCGHSGIINTLEHAKYITGENKLYGIMGGFHLKKKDQQTMETINYLKNNNVQHIFPSHCTALPALSAFYDNFKINQLTTGQIFDF
jgi:7,8-dihydropterin-6-yl-methyl-4-(beta-D-ribofuranosyl)aminobenzene 5'-phosphate synthase